MTRRRLIAVAVAVASLGGAAVVAGEMPAPSNDVVVLQHCEIEYKRSSMVGVAHMGTTSTTILQDCYVRRGDRVRAGQVLGRVMDRDIRAELEIRKAEAENDIEVRVNEARQTEAVNRLKRTEALQKRVLVSAEELRAHELEAITSKLQVEQSKYRLQLAEFQRRHAEALARAREYISPHDGVVVEVRKEQGEAVSYIEPNFQVVDVDALKVTGYLNLNDFWRVKEGQAVRISPDIDGDDLPVEREVFTGRIVFVDRRIDPTNRTCKVVAEVANRDLLLASGLEARMEILIDPSPSGPGPSASTTSPPASPRADRVLRPGPTDVRSEQPESRVVGAP